MHESGDAGDPLAFFTAVLEHLPAMVFVKDARDLRFVHFNRAGEELLGLPRTQMLGKTDYDFFPREQADFFVSKDREVLRRGTVEDIPEEPISTPRGTRWLHTRKIPVKDAAGETRYLLGVSVDITERREAGEKLRQSHETLERSVVERTEALRAEVEGRRRTEEALALTERQLRQAQKMEAIGRLAGGVAHDFNNLLTVILGYASLMLKKLPAGSELRIGSEEIRRAGARAQEMTRQLLAFSRQQVLQPRTFDLRESVRGTERIIRQLLGEDIEVIVDMGPHPLWVLADPAQIEQVLMNLVVNARDAMPEGGRLEIRGRAGDLDAFQRPAPPGAAGGTHAVLSVRDTGVGMDAGVKARIFEPFFSTKPRDKGTGLGLSTAFGIVRQSGGVLVFDSDPGKGATFEVALPRTAPPSAAPEPAAPKRRSLRGTETVLLVEDEDGVRLLLARTLEDLGYAVLTASRPSQALALAESHAGPLHLLITDVVMPEMTGRQLAEKILARRPETRLVFMSGYAEDAVVRDDIVRRGLPFLHKPITETDLGTLVREVLEAKVASGGPAK
jgi:PAS domain S-box-containing protein